MLPPIVEAKLHEARARREELEKQLADPATLASPARLRSTSREFGEVTKLVSRFDRLLAAREELASNRELAEASGEDEEIRSLARDEIERLEPLLESLEIELIDRLIVEDEDASRSVIIEIRAGTGGDEAALFAGDLFRMYTKFAEHRGWKTELLDGHATDLGGFREIVFGVSGEDVHRDLRYESGGHRVQRVPETETSGRIHTSAATVAVLGEPEEVEVDIKDSDIRMDFYRSSGPGGQNVNKTSSAVRLTHLPTGIVVAIQEESSQHKNRAKAMRVLRSRVYAKAQEERIEREQAERRSQVGSGDRSQRIRTYNFPQNRCTDHRIGQNFSLERVIEGQLDQVVESLRAHERETRLKEL